ncbi:MAG: hypothetical protein IPJ55_10720 [Chloracidobacterium sp.]|nr:hypothetical protein [Chloracidobacterium sp.]
MQSTNCPKCSSDDTQSFDMAHKSGSSSGLVIGVGTTHGNLGVGGGYQKTKSGLAKQTEPPNEDSDVGSGIAFIFIAIFIFNFVGSPLSLLLAWVLGRENWDLTSWLVGMFIGLVAAITFVVLARKYNDSQKTKVAAAYKVALMKWQHSWICLRCGNTFYVRDGVKG